MERFLQIVGVLVLGMFVVALGLLGWFCMSGVGQKTTGVIDWILTYGVMWIAYGVFVLCGVGVQAVMLSLYTKIQLRVVPALVVWLVLGVIGSSWVPAVIFCSLSAPPAAVVAVRTLAVALFVLSLLVVAGYGWYSFEETRAARGAGVEETRP